MEENRAGTDYRSHYFDQFCSFHVNKENFVVHPSRIAVYDLLLYSLY